MVRVATAQVPNQVQQAPPVQLGTSTSISITQNATCYAGTLGAALVANGLPYVLSNARVLGGARNNLVQTVGNLDATFCTGLPTPPVLNVASVTAWKMNTFIDAAIALAQVDEDNNLLVQDHILLIPGFNATSVKARIGQVVKKSGRTTSLTWGQITAINVAVLIGVTTFENQIAINALATNPGPFLSPGASGSLVLVCNNYNTRQGKLAGDNQWHPTGLLFAGTGDNVTGYANQIDKVLNSFKAVVGGPLVVSSDAPSNACLNDLPDRVGGGGGETQRGVTVSDDEAAAASAVRDRHVALLRTVPGIVAHGIGASRANPERAAIKVYVREITPQVRQILPAAIEGIPIEVEKSASAQLF
jgi:hypothetical protein